MTGLKILLVVSLVVQLLATIFAIRLIRRTKYNSIWILCIIAFSTMVAERILHLMILDGKPIDPHLLIILGGVVSLCISVAVLFAHRLVNYLDRVDRQRSLFNKRILTAVLRTEERARQNFSKELHDGLGPLLSSAKMSLSAISQNENQEEQQELLKNTIYVIDEAIRSVREISNNMSPQILIDFGLAQAVRNFVTRSSALHGVNIRLNTNLRAERFDSDVEVIIYRVVCELINNSLKHSGCTAITLSLNFDGTALSLNYTDNGRGFNPEAMIDCGMGLSNIASRIGSLSGSLDIRSSKGKGMSADISVNIDNNH
ncbi:MAG: sensor histidine kinase [Alistipes sp.]|nr:sensor histidine kinase [Alistipes sp.]